MSNYTTNDIYLSAFIVASGISKLVGIEDQNSGRKLFVFEPTPSAELILKFYSGDGKVSALRLIEALQSLKAATYVVNSRNFDKPQNMRKNEPAASQSDH